MKITLLAVFILFAATAFGQAVSSEPQIYVVPDHPRHAAQHDMASEVSLVGGGAYTYAQGERPLWEFGPAFPPPPPLGDVARAFRKQKMEAKRAEIVFEKQGS